MGTHYFTAGYFNPILFTSAVGHQIRFIHSRASFSERGRASRIQYLHLYWKNLQHVVFGSASLTLIGEQDNVKNCEDCSAKSLKATHYFTGATAWCSRSPLGVWRADRWRGGGSTC